MTDSQAIIALLTEIRDLLMPKDADGAALAAILPRLEIGKAFTSADVLQRAKRLDPELDIIIARTIGWDATSANRLGKMLAAAEGTPIDGLRIRKVKHDHGAVLWTCELV